MSSTLLSPTSETNGTPESAQPPVPAPVSPRPLTIRIVGLGGAGCNAIAHMAKTGLQELHPVALHTNARILEMISAPDKILLGGELTHGLGAGGDPSLGRAAAEHGGSVLKNLCQEVDLLFVVTGLGGGTGTGVAPVLARMGKEAGALVIGLATLPFEDEGARRRRQAQQGLEELRAAADAVICLPNQKLFRIVDENTSVLDGLNKTNELLAQGIQGLWQMLTRPSLIHVDFADLRAVLRDQHVEACFATVEAQGEARSREVIEQLLASPLLDDGQALAEADAVLVSLFGGPDLSLADIRKVMEEINRRTDNAHVTMGASVTEEMRGRLGITLVASRKNPAPDPGALPSPRSALQDSPSHAPQSDNGDLDSRLIEPSVPACGASRFVPPPPSARHDSSVVLGLNTGGGRSGTNPPRRLQQGNLPLEIVSKGRFEKSQPTIHRGEDLDIPTYVRRGIPLN
ncbi:MAG: cell division protein FtsZ [Verrucomicrobiia bacterium]